VQHESTFARESRGMHIYNREATVGAAAKKYRAYWSRDFHNPGARRVDEAFFTEELCYSKDDIVAIRALVVGETWESWHYGSAHIVTRLA